MPHFPKPWFREPRGVWVVQIQGKQHNLGPDKEVAFRRYYELMAEQPTVGQAQCTAVVALLDLFLDACYGPGRERTYEWYKRFLVSFAKTIDRSLETTFLKPYHVTQWLNQHPKWSLATRRGAIAALQRALRWAVLEGYIDHSPIANIKKPASQSRKVVIAIDQWQKILSAATDAQFLELLTVMSETGCRPQEAVNVEARLFDAREQRWVFPKEESKGKRWERVVYLTDVAAGITKRQAETYPEGKLFRNADGAAWDRNSVRCRFRRMPNKVGGKFCAYHIRHTWATRAIQNGVDPITVAILLGHVDASTVARVYQHLSMNPNYLREAVRRAVKGEGA